MIDERTAEGFHAMEREIAALGRPVSDAEGMEILAKHLNKEQCARILANWFRAVLSKHPERGLIIDRIMNSPACDDNPYMSEEELQARIASLSQKLIDQGGA